MQMTKQGKVLVFDSGMGGLTIAREIRAMAPQLSVVYAADNGFFPYGNKSDDDLQARLPQLARALVGAVQPDVFVIACNTASTLALQAVRDVLDIPVVGTVPAIKPAVALSATKTIGLLATPGTLRRKYTAELVNTHAADAQIIMHGSVELVHMAEAQAAGEPVALEVFRRLIDPLFAADVSARMDTIVLACTHFPLIRGELAAAIPRPISFVDSGEAIARQTLRCLPQQSGGTGQAAELWVTSPLDPSDRLAEVCRRFGFAKVKQLEPSV